MTAGEYCKPNGIDSVKELSILSNKPVRSLYDIFRDNDVFFEVIVHGAYLKKTRLALEQIK